ncbi:MAG: nitrous oxide-stimulated promoter family protein [Candidatus Binatia bacterium]|jgi:hypothetical protein
MNAAATRTNRERRTIEAMIRLFCRDQHGMKRSLCVQCAELQAYARQRLEKCPYGDDKPTCANCPIHCYKPSLRQQVQTVMRYAGPRMLRHHPILAVRHMLDERRLAPERPRKGKRSDLIQAPGADD